MKHLAWIIALSLCAGAALAQQADMGDYTSLSIQAGRMSGTFGSAVGIRELSGGVKIVLHSDQPGVDALPIAAGAITFDWPGGQAMPNAINMTGNVTINHPEFTAKAQRAEWDLDGGDLVFIGDVVISSDVVREMRGSRFTLNLNTGAFEVEQGEVDEMEFQGVDSEAAEASPHLLSASDISDWPGFINALKAQAAADGDSPGKHLVSQLPDDLQAALTNMPTENLLTQQSLLVDQLNSLLRQPDFYDEAAFAGADVSAEAQALLDTADRSADQTIELNRLLLRDAFPDYVRGA